MSDDQDPKKPFQGFRIEIDPEKLDEFTKKVRAKLDELRAKAEDAYATGQHHKVRVSYKGKQVGPDLPLGAVLAGEGVALFAFGPLMLLLGNLGAKVMLDIELIHESDELVEKGKSAWGDGEAEAAEAHYRDALQRRRDDPSALYNLGVLLRVTGRSEEAAQCFRQAVLGPAGHPDVARAAEALDRMAGKRTL